MKVLVPDSLALTFETSDENFQFIKYSVSATDFSAVQDAELLVLWMNTDANLKAAVTQLKQLKLVQTLAAGPDHALSAGFDTQIAIASGRSLHDKPVTEHALALILASVRHLDELLISQKNSYWSSEYISAQAALESSHLYTLNGSKVLVVGFGSIASQLSPILTALGAEVRGAARNSGHRSGYEVVEITSISKILSEFDIVISLLPYSAETEKFFDKDFFGLMKKSAIFINIGRGKTVDEDALLQALNTKEIRRAAIDVSYVEPLPNESPLWKCPQLIITPHISGGRPLQSEKLITANALNLANSQPILNLVAR